MSGFGFNGANIQNDETTKILKNYFGHSNLEMYVYYGLISESGFIIYDPGISYLLKKAYFTGYSDIITAPRVQFRTDGIISANFIGESAYFNTSTGKAHFLTTPLLIENIVFDYISNYEYSYVYFIGYKIIK